MWFLPASKNRKILTHLKFIDASGDGKPACLSFAEPDPVQGIVAYHSVKEEDFDMFARNFYGTREAKFFIKKAIDMFRHNRQWLEQRRDYDICLSPFRKELIAVHEAMSPGELPLALQDRFINPFDERERWLRGYPAFN